MPACESKLVSRSSRKATVAKAVFVEYRLRSHGRMPSLVGDRGLVLRVVGWALTTTRDLSLVLHSCTQDLSRVVVCGTEP